MRTIALDAIQNLKRPRGIAQFIKFARNARPARSTRPRAWIFSEVEKLPTNAPPTHELRPEGLEDPVAYAPAP